jgi:hypothetical protein
MSWMGAEVRKPRENTRQDKEKLWYVPLILLLSWEKM